MKQHIDQASHNEEFSACLDGKFPDKFYDWKITVLFYTALHWIHALASMKGIDIGQTHKDVAANINPKKHGTMAISNNAWSHYNSLWSYSHTARYEGITDISTFEQLKQIDHAYALENVAFLRKYIQGQKLPI